ARSGQADRIADARAGVRRLGRRHARRRRATVGELRDGGDVVSAVNVPIEIPIDVTPPAPHSAPSDRSALAMIDQLLRNRGAILDRITAGQGLAGTMRVMVATIAVAMAVVGAAIGTYRGDIQIAYAAIKLPLVILGTAALSAPALTAIGAALGRKSRLASDLA